jgi:hypothetical protein
MAKKTKPTSSIPAQPVVLIINWLRTYAARFTDPAGGRKPVKLSPGANEITEDMLPVLERHREHLRRLELAGHLRLESPTVREQPSSPRAPTPAATHEADDDEAAELESLRARLAAERDKPPVAPTPAATAGSAEPPLPAALPPWSPTSSYEDLKVAATARGIEFPGNVSKAKLLEDLEAYEDEQLLGDDEADDDEGTGTGG